MSALGSWKPLTEPVVMSCHRFILSPSMLLSASSPVLSFLQSSGLLWESLLEGRGDVLLDEHWGLSSESVFLECLNVQMKQ